MVRKGWVGVAIPKELADRIDKLVGHYGYRSRNDVVADAIRQLLRAYGLLPEIKIEKRKAGIEEEESDESENR
ncbi:hypothetical protein DRJ17_04635 [Candidatus Woesearchaeota archaeon]|nr:MAG: hypothetical protein DRJ17_04635 [Candidatus Woesearchaeota archaeon]